MFCGQGTPNIFYRGIKRWVKVREIQTAISVLPIGLFCWELSLFFPVGTSEELWLPHRFRVGFIGLK